MKRIFILIQLILLAMGADFGIRLLHKTIPDGYPGVQQHISDAGEDPGAPAGEISGTAPDSKDLTIMQRNLFRVRVSLPVPDSRPPEKPDEKQKILPADPALKLWGTVTGSGQMFAVIEDTKKRIQYLHQVGDSVQGAVVREISAHRVVITVDGKERLLEMKTEPSVPGEPEPESPPAAETEEIVVESSMISEFLQHADDIGKGVKTRPHMTDGVAAGLMLYSIRPMSLPDQLGFKNGDILRQVDGIPALSEEHFNLLFQGLENASSATRVVILRRGTPKEFIFHVRDTSGDIRTHEETGD